MVISKLEIEPEFDKVESL